MLLGQGLIFCHGQDQPHSATTGSASAVAVVGNSGRLLRWGDGTRVGSPLARVVEGPFSPFHWVEGGAPDHKHTTLRLDYLFF